jgi:succinate dehydrogenase / fumarate reductase flavoprotein subunit
MPNAAEHIKRKLPSMHHQFMRLADIDITQQPMEVGPTTHYMMGGVRVDGDTQMSTVDGLFAAGECAAGVHGANRLGGNSLSDLVVFGKRAGEHAASFARDVDWQDPHEDQIEEAARAALVPFERGNNTDAESSYKVQHDLQELMQERVGIVRKEAEMARALDEMARLRERAVLVQVEGHRQYNPDWHNALDLRHLLTVAEAITRAGLARPESRGAHFREDFPNKDDACGKTQIAIRKGEDGTMRVSRVSLPDIPAELTQIIEEMK